MDPVINGLVFVLIAYLCLLWSDERLRGGFMVLIVPVVAAVALSLTKPVYTVISLLVLCIPRARFASKFAHGFFVGCVFCVMAVMNYLWSAAVRLVFIPQSGFSLAGQVQYILAHPLAFGKLLFDHLVAMRFYVSQMVGFMGWLDVRVPQYIVAGFVLLFLSLIIFDGPAKNPLSRFARIAMESAGVLTILAIIVVMYGYNNLPGSVDMRGIQGRYFIPALAVSCVGASGIRWRFSNRVPVSVLPVLLVCARVFIVFALVVAVVAVKSRYYG
jgi:uncharacterized membrane protein